jgi:predicted nucleotide-binding protein
MPRQSNPTEPVADDDPQESSGSGRAFVNQSDLPRHTLQEALRVARAINDNYAKRPTKPLRVAEAMGIAPTTGHFRTLASAANAYGITDGSAWANEISLTPLGRRIVAPMSEGDDVAAMREAFLRPRIIGRFFRQYDGSKFPQDRIAANVLEELGVPASATGRGLELIKGAAKELGLLRTINAQVFVDLQGSADVAGDAIGAADGIESMLEPEPTPTEESSREAARVPAEVSIEDNRRVFITHGSNKAIVTQLEELLAFGKFEPVIAVKEESAAKPVPDKVLDAMRRCGAAIVHVGAERRLLDEDGQEQLVLNPNVLIEIGAAMALYGRRFILLVEQGVTLPSNLQGLYEVRYSGEKLDYDATMKLLRAFNDFRAGRD